MFPFSLLVSVLVILVLQLILFQLVANATFLILFFPHPFLGLGFSSNIYIFFLNLIFIIISTNNFIFRFLVLLNNTL